MSEGTEVGRQVESWEIAGSPRKLFR
uniref:RNA-dependent RNA polymerase n=1 Tax=Shrew picobirnavirus 2 TaxID=3139561 RepID=A0AB38ZKA6_9VIRU